MKILELSAREERVLEMREKERRTYRQIGHRIGSNAERARQIYEKAKRTRFRLGDLLDPDQEYRGLSTRAYNVIHCQLDHLGSGEEFEERTIHKAPTRAEIRRALEEGKVELIRYRGVGKKTFKEIMDWAGIEFGPRFKRCPHCGKEL